MPYDIGKTLKEYRNAAKISVQRISDILTDKGFKASASTIYSWENGNSQPTPGALLAMCEVYGIEDVLKTFGYNSVKKDKDYPLTAKERTHIKKYRVIDDHGKGLVDVVLETEYERCTAEPVFMPNAAHKRTDVTPSGTRHDEDVMDNPSEWD